jgi:hypothetical protein
VGIYDPPMPDNFESLARATLQPLIAVGETLNGVAAGVHQKTFGGSMYAIGATDRRLILQPVDRKVQAKGDPLFVTAETIQSVKLEGAGDGWMTAPMAVLDAGSLKLDLRTRDGQHLKLMMMKGGTGLMGALGGGEGQSEGVVALVEWLRNNAPPR